MPTVRDLVNDPPFREFSIPEQKAMLDSLKDKEWDVHDDTQKLGMLSQWKEREFPVKSEQPEAQIMGAVLGSVIPGGVSALGSKVLGGIKGLGGVAARAGVDLATEAAMQAGGLSNAGGAGMAAAGGIGPAVEGAGYLAKKAGPLAGRFFPNIAGILKEEGVATAKDAAAKLQPQKSPDYTAVNQAGQTRLDFPETLQHARDVEAQLPGRLYPSPESKRFAKAYEVFTQPIPGAPGFRQGITFDAAQRNISDIGDDIRKARLTGDNKLVKELTEQRNAIGRDFDQQLSGPLSKQYKDAGRAYRQQEAAKDVQEMVASSTKSAGGVDKINFDQAVNKLEKQRREDDFFAKSFPAGELDAYATTMRELASEVAKYSNAKEFAFTARMASILAGGLGVGLAAASVPTMIGAAMKTKSGRDLALRIVRGGGPTGSLSAFVENYRPGRAAAQGLRGGIEGGVGEEE